MQLLKALGIALGIVSVTALVGLVMAIGLVGGKVVVALLMLATALASLLFGRWLKAGGHEGHAQFFIRASFIMGAGLLLGFKLPNVAPGGIARMRSWFTTTDQDNQRAALELLRPKPISCDRPPVWWHPCDDPPVCYDKAGEHPRCGQLQEASPAIAWLIMKSQRPLMPPQVPVRVEAQPAPLPSPPAPPTTEPQWQSEVLLDAAQQK